MRNQKQIDALHDDTRFKFILAGRRGGKSFLMTYDICRTIRSAPKGAKVFYIGPTNAQAKALIWEPLKELFYQFKWKFTERVADQYFELTGKRRIYVIGSEKISRIRGHACYKVFLDEVAFFSKDLGALWRAVRPTLSDQAHLPGGGGAVLATTPDGRSSQAYELFLQAQTKHNWSVHTWKTIDNPFIPRQEIEDARKELDAKSFRQEYEAQWESFVGLAYYEFSETKHIKPQKFNPALDIHLVQDFNVNPTSLLLSQWDGQALRYFKEYSFPNSSTVATIKAFVEDFKHLKTTVMLKIRGDSAGKNRSSNTGRSDYFYVQEILDHEGFQYQMEVLGRNPAIIDRVKHANSWLQPLSGEPKIYIDPSCKDLIKDLAAQELNGRHPSDKNNLGHKADAFGYDIYWQQLQSTRKKAGSIRL